MSHALLPALRVDDRLFCSEIVESSLQHEMFETKLGISDLFNKSTAIKL